MPYWESELMVWVKRKPSPRRNRNGSPRLLRRVMRRVPMGRVRDIELKLEDHWVRRYL